MILQKDISYYNEYRFLILGVRLVFGCRLRMITPANIVLC